jgi:hypothetical protein
MNTTPVTLDVASLPGSAVFTNEAGSIDFGELLMEKLEPLIITMEACGIIKKTENFGFAMAKPGIDLIDNPWDDPTRLVWMTIGWGPDQERYIANAVRKMRYSARTTFDSIECDVLDFNTPVNSVEDDGTYLWGDFPWGGAAWYGDLNNGLLLLGGVSGYTQQQDHIVAQLILSTFDLAIFELNQAATTS